MGIMNEILGGNGPRTVEDCIKLDLGDLGTTRDGASFLVYIAEIDDQQGAITIEDVAYDGDLVIADVTHRAASDNTMEHITDDLRQVTREIDGNIIQKGNDQIVITPAGTSISRQKLND